MLRRTISKRDLKDLQRYIKRVEEIIEEVFKLDDCDDYNIEMDDTNYLLISVYLQDIEDIVNKWMIEIARYNNKYSRSDESYYQHDSLIFYLQAFRDILLWYRKLLKEYSFYKHNREMNKLAKYATIMTLQQLRNMGYMLILTDNLVNKEDKIPTT